jgi:hypothetical protein
MSYKALVINTLSQDSYVSVNKKLAKKLGFTEAGLLAELIFTYKGAQIYNSFYDNGNQGEWFYLTQATIEDRLGIKRREHDTAIKNLVSKSVIFKKKMGLPAKSYYIINWQRIVDIVDNSDETPPEPAPLSECTKRTNKDGVNVQTRMDEPYKQDSAECTSIHINKKELKEKDKTNINNKKIVNKAGELISKDELVNIGNDYYSEFASGRWSKRQWKNIIDKLTTEIVEREVKLRDVKAYMLGCFENIAYSHDLKNGKIEIEYEQRGNVPFYNWLESIEEQEDEMPW